MPANSFEQIRQFVAAFTGASAAQIDARTTLFGDLGINGDDGDELLACFGERFNVDMSAFEQCKHFGSEGFWPWAPLHWLLLRLRKGTPEQKSGRMAISVADLVHAAEKGVWPSCIGSQRP